MFFFFGNWETNGITHLLDNSSRTKSTESCIIQFYCVLISKFWYWYNERCFRYFCQQHDIQQSWWKKYSFTKFNAFSIQVSRHIFTIQRIKKPPEIPQSIQEDIYGFNYLILSATFLKSFIYFFSPQVHIIRFSDTECKRMGLTPIIQTLILDVWEYSRYNLHKVINAVKKISRIFILLR